MHDDLRMLRQLREEVERIAKAIDRAIEEQEDHVAEAQAREHRKNFKLVAIPMGIGVAAAAARAWMVRNSQTIAAAGASAAVTVAATLGAVHLSDDRPGNTNQVVTAPAEPPAASVSHDPPHRPHAGPPTRRPAQPPEPAPSGAPLVSASAVPRHVKLPRPADLTGSPIRTSRPSAAPTASDADEESCRIRLPHLLQRGLLCSRMVR